MELATELDRRFAAVRAAMADHELDALVVSGSEYTGFEGSVTYLSGFQIVHRYAYVVVPADGDAFVVFPSEEISTGRERRRWTFSPGISLPVISGCSIEYAL